MIKLCIVLGDDIIEYCGGLGMRFNRLLPYFNKELFDIKIFTIYNKEYIRELYGFKVYSCLSNPSVKHANKFSLSSHNCHMLLPMNVCNILMKQKWIPDIVLCSDHSTGVVGLYLSKIFGTKFIMEYDLALFSYEKIYSRNELSELNKSASTFISEVEQICCLESDLVIMCSKYYEDVCPYEMKRVVTIENGINLKEFDDIKYIDYKDYNFPNSKEGDINLVFIGRFNSQKGLHLLFNLDIPNNVNIYFVGSQKGGNLFNVILELCKIKKNYHYLGEKIDREKIIIMKKADAILFPSLHEPFGIVGLEAMASKTLCITTRVDGIGTYMLEDMCITIEEKNLQKAIIRFLNMSDNEKNKIIERAYNQVKNYTWSNISKKMIKTIREVLN